MGELEFLKTLLMSLEFVTFLTLNLFFPVFSASGQENSWPSGFTKHFLTYKDKMYYLELLGNALLEEFRTLFRADSFSGMKDLACMKSYRNFCCAYL